MNTFHTELVVSHKAPHEQAAHANASALVEGLMQSAGITGVVVERTKTFPMREPSTLPQAFRALSDANKVRLHRASLKRAIGELPQREGLRQVALILQNSTDSRLRTMKIAELIRACDHVGRSKTRRWLWAVDIRNEGRTLGEVTERQRQELAGLLGGAA